MESLKTDNNTSIWILVISLVFGLTLPFLIQDAMFQDAVLYSGVAHNQSVGFGTFWFPQYSTLNLEGLPSFHEQPPLVFGILSVCYKIFGSSIYVERGYTFLMLLLHIFLISTLWKEVYKNNPPYQKLSWLPVLLWILFPVCFWSFRNNMIENTMSVFILSSILVSYKAIQKEKSIWMWLLSGTFIFLASFSKGLPGLFPITFPIIYGLVYHKRINSKYIFYTFLLIIIPVIIYGILLLFPEPRESLSIYFYERLLKRVSEMPTTPNRFESIIRLFFESIPFLILLFLVMLFNVKKGINKILITKNEFLFFFLLGLCGIIPLMLTMVQKGWYMVPAFPYLGIAFASFIAPFIGSGGKNNLITKYLFPTAILTFSGVLICTLLQTGKISREKETLSDVYKIGQVVPKFSTITVPEDQYDQYNFVLQGFLVRYFHISISPYKEYDYFLTEKDSRIMIPRGYVNTDIPLEKYYLYKRSTQY
ncbi:MAG: glycosyltransferase family 39 protein [Saprospiraceae bacterium]|nr:glycosyltransferase family 39 protein [Saprospiraceae bacterium]MBK6564672.1 glycosyltransferase family 39 protein [Saprospiraceae bacterium]